MEHKEHNMVHETKAKPESKLKKGTITSRKDSEKSLKAESVDVVGTKPRPSISSNKENEGKDGTGQGGQGGQAGQGVQGVQAGQLAQLGQTGSSPKVPRKFINNWRQACDRTKDRTKELLKKWRTLPEGGHPEPFEVSLTSGSDEGPGNLSSGWSEHVWSEYLLKILSLPAFFRFFLFDQYFFT